MDKKSSYPNYSSTSVSQPLTRTYRVLPPATSTASIPQASAFTGQYTSIHHAMSSLEARTKVGGRLRKQKLLSDLERDLQRKTQVAPRRARRVFQDYDVLLCFITTYNTSVTFVVMVGVSNNKEVLPYVTLSHLVHQLSLTNLHRALLKQAALTSRAELTHADNRFPDKNKQS